MRILVFGTGAVGGYFGGLLAAAGNDVVFLARGERAKSLASQGLHLYGPRGDIHVARPLVVSSPDELAIPADITLLCVKTYDTASAVRALAGSPSGAGVVISLQNGVDAQERMRGRLPRVVPGLAFVSATAGAEGRIRYIGDMSSIVVGRFPAGSEDLGDEFAQACRNAGFGCDIVNDIDVRLWSKFVLLATNAALTALSRSPAGYVYHDADMRPVALAAIREVIAVANAEGIPLDPGLAETALAQASGFPQDMYASMYHDLVAGRSLELEQLSGSVVRRGKRRGVAVPVHATAYAALKPYLNGSVTGGNHDKAREGACNDA